MRSLLRFTYAAATLLSLLGWCQAEAASPDAPRGWRAYPNPFSVRFRIEMPESLIPAPPNSEMRVRVFDIHGRMLRHWSLVNYGQGWVIDWDGRTDAGASAPSGWYIFDIKFKDYPGNSGVRFKMLRIRGTPSSTYNWNWF